MRTHRLELKRYTPYELSSAFWLGFGGGLLGGVGALILLVTL